MPATTAVPPFQLFIIALTAFLTVVDLFATQALLPALTTHYQVTPAAMGLAVNACTLGMAIGGIGVALFSRRINRRAGILISLAGPVDPDLTPGLRPEPHRLHSSEGRARVVHGLRIRSDARAISAKPSPAEQSASAFAAYITGNVASNLIGRLDCDGRRRPRRARCKLHRILCAQSSPEPPWSSRLSKTRRRGCPRSLLNRCVQSRGGRICEGTELRAAFAIGFCILFAFIGTFTYVNFILVAPPLGGRDDDARLHLFRLSAVDHHDAACRARWRRRSAARPALWGALLVAVLGLPLLVIPSLPAVLPGMVLVAAGTFFAQALATGFVSRAAKTNRAAASGIYLGELFRRRPYRQRRAWPDLR